MGQTLDILIATGNFIQCIWVVIIGQCGGEIYSAPSTMNMGGGWHPCPLVPTPLQYDVLVLSVRMNMVIKILKSLIFRAKFVLDECGKKLGEINENPPTLTVSGIGHFTNSVVFAKVLSNTGLDSLNHIASKLPIQCSVHTY